MTQEMMNTALITCTGVSFVTALIAGVFAVAASKAWLANRREERAARAEMQEHRKRFAINTWIELVDMKTERIKDLEGRLDRMETLYGIARKLLDESEQRRLEKLEKKGFDGGEA